MVDSLIRYFIVFVMMLAFAGQTSAYMPMECDMSSNGQAMNMQMPSMQDMHDEETNELPECCMSECSCIQGTCHTVVILPEFYLALVQTTEDKINLVPTNVQQFDSQSLYRPPIVN